MHIIIAYSSLWLSQHRKLQSGLFTWKLNYNVEYNVEGCCTNHTHTENTQAHHSIIYVVKLLNSYFNSSRVVF